MGIIILIPLQSTRALLCRFNVAGNNKTYRNAGYFCPILTKVGFSRQIFIKVLNITIHENASNGRRDDTCGKTDGYDGGKRRLSHLCELAFKTSADLPLKRHVQPGGGGGGDAFSSLITAIWSVKF